jgi:putative tricarboxylic transport membrane protein
MKKLISIVFVVVLLASYTGICLSYQTSDKKYSAAANDFPNEPISIILPSSAGAPIDVMARKLAESASKHLNNVPINVINKTGGAGMVAMAATQMEKADGYTLHAEATGITSVLQLDGAPFKYTDFIPVSRIELDPFALFVKEGGEYQTIQDVIKDAKENPGEITIGGYGTATPHHLVAMQFAEEAGVNLKWVAFNSGSDAITAVMGNNLDLALSNISSLQRFEGKVKALAHSSEKPLNNFPNLKSFKEQGFGIEKYHWRGLFVKRGTSTEIVNQLEVAFNKAIEEPEFQKYLDTAGNLSGGIDRHEFEQIIEDQADGDLSALKKLNLIK